MISSKKNADQLTGISDSAPLSDNSLLEWARQGDSPPFTTLFQRHYDRVYDHLLICDYPYVSDLSVCTFWRFSRSDI